MSSTSRGAAPSWVETRNKQIFSCRQLTLSLRKVAFAFSPVVPPKRLRTPPLLPAPVHTGTVRCPSSSSILYTSLASPHLVFPTVWRDDGRGDGKLRRRKPDLRASPDCNRPASSQGDTTQQRSAPLDSKLQPFDRRSPSAVSPSGTITDSTVRRRLAKNRQPQVIVRPSISSDHQTHRPKQIPSL
ncbi:hypothetical protein DCS_01195 [Drechmeria coniospora]|uniref:Uncharacterized protein n=1 Tax=Drechmeria coniospora TaxID=98403 RepID=A0A151GSM1_DRECN|nr:hypothetical protein DCS_01195 [Drechmeria coniospora]KYK60061.1 hypothetical protein DCS_01195 [Drechmeria coniospora]